MTENDILMMVGWKDGAGYVTIETYYKGEDAVPFAREYLAQRGCHYLDRKMGIVLPMTEAGWKAMEGVVSEQVASESFKKSREANFETIEQQEARHREEHRAMAAEHLAEYDNCTCYDGCDGFDGDPHQHANDLCPVHPWREVRS